MAYYKARPIEIEAFRFHGFESGAQMFSDKDEPMAKWILDLILGGQLAIGPNGAILTGADGNTPIRVGDYLAMIDGKPTVVDGSVIENDFERKVRPFAPKTRKPKDETPAAAE
jgi:hypothetical protein